MLKRRYTPPPLPPHSSQFGDNTHPDAREIPCETRDGKNRQDSDRHLGGGRDREVRGGNQVGENIRLGRVGVKFHITTMEKTQIGEKSEQLFTST